MYVNVVHWSSPNGQNRTARTDGFQEETKCIDYDFYEKILIMIIKLKKKNKLAVFFIYFLLFEMI